MTTTKDAIVRLGSEFIRSMGYNAFSYSDISKTLGIKNAAIHYYFPSKGDLGEEIIRRNISAFRQLVAGWGSLTYREQYYNYIHMHDGFVSNHWVCIVGALAPSFDTLPEKMQQKLQELVELILDWLTRLLEAGQQAGEFSFQEPPAIKACMVHSTMLSALQMSKVLGHRVYESIQEGMLNL